MEIKRYLKIIQTWWWLVLVSLIIVTLAGFAFSFTRQPLYRASVTLMVEPRDTITDVDALRQAQDILNDSNVLNTYAEVMRSQKIYQQALVNMDFSVMDAPPATIAVSVVQNTNLMKVDAEGAGPAAVFYTVNTVTANGMDYLNNLDELYQIKVLDAAEVPQAPFTPNVPRDTGLSAALGLLLGLTLSFLAEYIRRPLESLEQMSIMDRDSSLYNRTYFLRRLRQEMSRMRRNKLPLTLCLLEMEVRDEVDRTYSRQIVKTVRRRANAFLKRHIRNNEILARWDGEVLAWMMFDTGETAARQGIERLSKLLESRLFEDDETGVTLTFSAVFGAVVMKDTVTEKELFDLCERTLQRAKTPGSGGVLIVTTAGPAGAVVQIDEISKVA